MNEEDERALWQRFTREVQALTNSEEQHVFNFEMSPILVMHIVATLQLALRHPDHSGIQRNPADDGARAFISGAAQLFRDAGLPAHAELVELGNNPAHDTPARKKRAVH